jgi:phage FluMu protein Com
MPDDDRKVVRCPSCGNWVMRAKFEGAAELNCKNSRCEASLEVTMRGGLVTVAVLSTKK